jgi:hypothetical protein
MLIVKQKLVSIFLNFLSYKKLKKGVDSFEIECYSDKAVARSWGALRWFQPSNKAVQEIKID